MEYMTQLNRFFEKAEEEDLPASAQIVYLHLLNINNRLHWCKWFKVANSRLENLTGLKSNKSVVLAKNRLKQAGLLEFKSDGKVTTRYKLIPISLSTQDGTQDGTQDSTQDSTQLIRQDKTKTRQYIKAKMRIDVFESSSETEEVKKALKDFADMRTKARSPMTDRAKEILLKKLNDMAGNDNVLKVKLLEQSIERGWKTLYALKDEGGNDARRMGRTHETDRGGGAEKERADSFREECRRADANQIYPWEVHEPA